MSLYSSFRRPAGLLRRLLPLFCFVAGIGAATVPARADLILSELCDPRLDYLTDRFIEITNTGGTAVDLSGWQVVAVGNSTDIFTWNLSGTLAPGASVVCGDATTVVSFPVDFGLEDWSTSNSTWNGKVGDGARLVDPSSNVVDAIVATGTLFENDDLVRNPDVVTANPASTAAEWTATPVDLPTQGSPGTHSFDAGIAIPAVVAVWTDPAVPLAADSVDVFADVVDSVATITSVVLRWGLDAANLDQSQSMSLLTGITYRTDLPLPPQPEGVTVHYRVEATNDVPVTAPSADLAYTVATVLSIAQIQGAVGVSPYAGQEVLTSGVVTGVFDPYFTIQDGTGVWSGVWVESTAQVSRGDSVVVQGTVTENAGVGFENTTLLSAASVLQSVSAASVPAAAVLASSVAGTEAYEGVLVQIVDAPCTDPSLGGGEWELDDGSGPVRVGPVGTVVSAVLGTRYTVTGPVLESLTGRALEPRDLADVVVVADDFAPVVDAVEVVDAQHLVVDFSETVDPATAFVATNYRIDGIAALDATSDPGGGDRVALLVSTLATSGHELRIDGVADLAGNVAVGIIESFSLLANDIPPGYYDSAVGLYGDALRAALHQILTGHTQLSYSGLWTAFYTTDDKPNGKVWDIYSDVPGGTPPYEYTFGVDQGGTGASEGQGYNREHTWPTSWYGSTSVPMYTDLFVVYPVDAYVNTRRSNNPYGEVATPTWTSLNGSKLGPNTYPGYSGTVFEPIDEYKGDLARNYFYVTARYYTEDAGWSSSPMTNGADIEPWAVAMLLQWHEQDPVSAKEIERNSAVFALQGNRNPFIDHPEWAARLYETGTGVETPARVAVLLRQNVPNPFNPVTEIAFELPWPAPVRLAVYDLAGREVRTLLQGDFDAGEHRVVWDGRDGRGSVVGAGTYFYRLAAPTGVRVRKMVLVK